MDHGIEQLETAGIRELHSVVADKKWKTVAVAGLAKYALVPRLGVGLGQGTKHCMMQMIVAIVGKEVDFVVIP